MDPFYPYAVFWFPFKEAIKENSFFPSCKQKLSRGDVTVGEARSDHVLEGCVKIGGQDHFYLEPQVAYVVPSDTNEYDVYAATQDPSGAQVRIEPLNNESEVSYVPLYFDVQYHNWYLPYTYLRGEICGTTRDW